MKTLFAEFTALPGHEAQVAQLMAGLTEQVRREPGNVQFLPCTRADEPRRWFVFEQYRDEAAFRAHITAEYGREFNAALVQHIVEDGSRLTWLTEA